MHLGGPLGLGFADDGVEKLPRCFFSAHEAVEVVSIKLRPEQSPRMLPSAGPIRQKR